MQEFILTLVVFFVLFKVLGEFSGNKGPVKIFYFNQRNPNDHNNKGTESTVQKKSPEKKINKDDEGEYIDYEEIKD
jgi:hypothetical protein